jgi:hypothetical protein
MYNYYLNEKRVKQEKEKEDMERKQQKMKTKRKHEMTKLITGHEARLKNFLYNMASEPITIVDYNNNVQSSRKNYLDENSNKILGRHGFILKGYKTEKQRIEDYLKERNFGFLPEREDLQYLMRDRDSYVWDNSKKILSNEPEHTIQQPSMRFKHRSELERIADINNAYSYGRVDMKIIQKQLRAMGLSVSQKFDHSNQSFSSFIDDDYMPFLSVNGAIEKQKSIEKEKQKSTREKILKERTDMKDRLNKKYHINEARNIMSDLHTKTHFKGSTNFALFNKTNVFFNHKKTESMTDLPSQKDLMIKSLSSNSGFGKSLSNSASKTALGFKNKIPPKTIINADIKHELANMNPLLFNLGTNTYRITKDEEGVDEEKLNRVKQLAYGSPKRKVSMGFLNNIKSRLKDSPASDRMFRKGSFLSILDDNYANPEKKTDDRDKIKIGEEKYDRNDLENIAKKVLTNCNFFHSKSQNNNHSLKSREGKLMQTNGMSISEFSKKFKLTFNK